MTAEVGLLTSDEAAALLGLSVYRVRALARSGALPARRVGGRYWFERGVVERWHLPVTAEDVVRVARSVHVPPYRYLSPDRRPHAELLEALGLSDEELAGALGVPVRRVQRWHVHGVANVYVGRLRGLADRLGVAG